MKDKITIVVGIVLAMILSRGASPLLAAELVVSPGGLAEPRCPFPLPHYSLIQLAVNAANTGDKIMVCPGIYAEQVTISKSLQIQGPPLDPGANLTDSDDAIIMPSSMTPNTIRLSDPSLPVAAIVLIQNTEHVTLTNLTVDGANNNINGCAPELIGIYYQSASGQVEDAAVRNLKLAPALAGCQSGTAVVIESGNGKSSSVKMIGSSIHDYQKNGTAAFGVGTEASFQNNVVTGNGPLSNPSFAIAAQNGLQVSDGATGEISGNTVTDNIYASCISVSECTVASTDILIFNSDGIKVQNNTVGDTNIAIYVQGNHGEVKGNHVFNSKAFDGIDLIGAGNEADSNLITHSDEAGIFIQGNDNDVTQNTINEVPVGVLKIAPSAGNIINENQFLNTHVPVVDPSAPPARIVSPF